MNGLFGYDSKFFSIVNKIVDCFFVSFLWIVFSLPVVTFGTASTALYYTVHKSIRSSRGYIWQSFWGAFKSNLKQMTIIWLIMMGIFAFLFADYRIMAAAVKQGRPFEMLCYIFLVLMMFWAVWCVYLFAYSARFDSGIKHTIKNGALILLLNLPWSLLVLILLAAGVFLVYLVPPLLFLLPAAITCIYEIFLEKIFRKYMSREDLEKEKQLEGYENHGR